MLDILFLALIAYLVARVIWNIFSVFERFFTSIGSLFSRRTSVKSTEPSPSFEQKELKKTKEEKRSLPQVDSKKKQVKLESVPKDQPIIREVVREPIKQDKIQKKESLKLEQPDEVIKVKEQKVISVRVEEIPVTSNTVKLQEYESKIKSLAEEIEIYHQKRQLSIQRIGELIQHVAKKTELVEQSGNTNEDEQLNAIKKLKHELKLAQHKANEERTFLTNNLSKEKEQVVQQYQEKIRTLTLNFNTKASQYQATIKETAERIQYLEQAASHKQSEAIEQKHEQQQRNQGEHEKFNQLSKQFEQLKQDKTAQAHRNEDQIKTLKQQLQNSKQELKRIREVLAKVQNDQLEYQTKHQAQINSLQKHNQELTENLQRSQSKIFNMQQQTEQLRSKFQDQQHTGQRVNRQLTTLQEKLVDQIKKRESIEQKCQMTQEQLKFCQQQLQNSKDLELELRECLQKANETPKKSERVVKKEDIENSPDYIRLKMEVDRLKRKLAQKQENISRAKTPGGSNKQERQLSPNQVVETMTTPSKRLSPTSLYQNRKVSPYERPTSTKPSHIPASTILLSEDRRSNTPLEKKIVASTINEGTITQQVYLGETEILSETERNFIIHQVSHVKKITVKKTRLMYSLRQKGSKPIHQFILGAPNIILVAQLENNKIVGAFSQNAFSKENKFIKSSIVSKAMIFDVSRQVFITNEGQGQCIRCQENALMWGNKQFVVNCQEPVSISVDLNCQGAVYLSNYSTAQFLDSQQSTLKVLKLEIHRVFLG